MKGFFDWFYKIKSKPLKFIILFVFMIFCGLFAISLYSTKEILSMFGIKNNFLLLLIPTITSLIIFILLEINRIKETKKFMKNFKRLNKK